MTEDNKEIGKVIWFDRKKGFGFIRVISSTENKDREVFCHYSKIESESPYKKLIPGECVSLIVEFNSEAEENKQYSSTSITGPFGTELMCDNNTHNYKIYPKKRLHQKEEVNVNEDEEQ